MNIVYTSDNNFVPQIAAAVTSVIANNMSQDVDFYILSKGITPANKRVISEHVKRMTDKCSGDHRVLFKEIGDIRALCGMDIDTGGWNDIVLARLFLDRLLPPDVDKVLYLDGDTIVRRSLEELWNTDISGYVLGAVMEPTIDPARKRDMGLTDYYYHNAGVLLINIAEWKRSSAGERILRCFEENEGHLFSNDQDAINIELKDEILELPIIYNFCNTYSFYPYEAIVKMVGEGRFYDVKTYVRYAEDPVIIHYLGEERPWRIGNRHPYSRDFFKYYNMTPWGRSRSRRNDIMESGWEVYYFCFYIFNAVMKPFPMMRLRIINSLIPAVLRFRKK